MYAFYRVYTCIIFELEESTLSLSTFQKVQSTFWALWKKLKYIMPKYFLLLRPLRHLLRRKFHFLVISCVTSATLQSAFCASPTFQSAFYAPPTFQSAFYASPTFQSVFYASYFKRCNFCFIYSNYQIFEFHWDS